MYPGYFKNLVPPMYSIPPYNVHPGTGQNPQNLQDTQSTMTCDIRYMTGLYQPCGTYSQRNS